MQLSLNDYLPQHERLPELLDDSRPVGVKRSQWDKTKEALLKLPVITDDAEGYSEALSEAMDYAQLDYSTPQDKLIGQFVTWIQNKKVNGEKQLVIQGGMVRAGIPSSKKPHQLLPEDARIEPNGHPDVKLVKFKNKPNDRGRYLIEVFDKNPSRFILKPASTINKANEVLLAPKMYSIAAPLSLNGSSIEELQAIEKYIQEIEYWLSIKDRLHIAEAALQYVGEKMAEARNKMCIAERKGASFSINLAERHAIKIEEAENRAYAAKSKIKAPTIIPAVARLDELKSRKNELIQKIKSSAPVTIKKPIPIISDEAEPEILKPLLYKEELNLGCGFCPGILKTETGEAWVCDVEPTHTASWSKHLDKKGNPIKPRMLSITDGDSSMFKLVPESTNIDTTQLNYLRCHFCDSPIHIMFEPTVVWTFWCSRFGGLHQLLVNEKQQLASWHDHSTLHAKKPGAVCIELNPEECNSILDEIKNLDIKSIKFFDAAKQVNVDYAENNDDKQK